MWCFLRVGQEQTMDEELSTLLVFCEPPETLTSLRDVIRISLPQAMIMSASFIHITCRLFEGETLFPFELPPSWLAFR